VLSVRATAEAIRAHSQRTGAAHVRACDQRPRSCHLGSGSHSPNARSKGGDGLGSPVELDLRFSRSDFSDLFPAVVTPQLCGDAERCPHLGVRGVRELSTSD
jgi:hypothetical protein